MAIHFYRQGDDYGCFSNFSKHPVVVDGVRWPTTEHYFQAMKFPHEPERQEKIRANASPMISKRIAWARDARPRSDWDSYRKQVMLVALRHKFAQHSDIREILLGTGEEELVEHTAKDSYWGDGGDGRGANMLGKLLMKVRTELRGGMD